MDQIWIYTASVHHILLGATFYPVEAPDSDRTSNAAICFWYMVYVIATGVALICFASGLLWLTLLLQLIPAGIFAIILFSALSIHRRSAEKTASYKNEIEFIRDATMKLQSIVEHLDDRKQRNRLKICLMLYDQAQPNQTIGYCV
jgi:hypothetical protein